MRDTTLRPALAAALAWAVGYSGAAVTAPAEEVAAGWQAPTGYHLVGEEDCGSVGQKHVLRGQFWEFAAGSVKGPGEYRRIVFDAECCVLRFDGPDPKASYKLDVVYANEAGRRQRLEVNGREVHGQLDLPAGRPGRFVFDIPGAAYADGKCLELRFINVAGANAVVAYVRIWSTSEKKLAAPPLAARAKVQPRPPAGPRRPEALPAPLWQADGPIEEDWSRQDRLRGRPSFADWQDPTRQVEQEVLPCIDEQVRRGRRILADIRRMGGPDVSGEAAALAAAAKASDDLLAAKSLDPDRWRKVYVGLRWAVRRLALRNPLLKCDGLLFVRRHHSTHMHQCARRMGAYSRPGGDICVLSEIRPDGQGRVRSVTKDVFPPGLFGRPDVSFDGKRIVFGYAMQATDGWSSKLLRSSNACRHFQVWETSLEEGDPSGPRQLTTEKEDVFSPLRSRSGAELPVENSDPLYLPDGRIAFMSFRAGGLVQCGDWARAFCLYTIRPDGTDLRQITWSKEGEWDPSLLDDGTILFTRWEYMMRFWSPTQMIWSVRPDGTNPRIIYGSDLGRSYGQDGYRYPLNYAMCRQIPGTGKLVCIGSAHHNTGAGPVCIVDLNLGREDPAGLKRLTPVRYVETPDRMPHNGWYDCPYGLSEDYFLVSYTFSPNERDETGYALYLLDTYGGKELIHRDKELSAMFPMPIRRRLRPAPLPELNPPRVRRSGEFFIHDVHRGLPDWASGKARYLRVVAAHERHVYTNPDAVEVGPDSGFETKVVLGTVPVEADGSAYFRVPAGKAVFFAVLDENYQSLHVMRMTTTVRPGERLSCVGCHEPMNEVPPNRPPLAVRRGASEITPPPWGVQPLGFARLIQPILNRHCIRCHNLGARVQAAAGRAARPKVAD